ncbi:MAG TPA: YggT family protein [Marmoricola sp.]|nr:YggT family protein [Marmoricola sp.]
MNPIGQVIELVLWIFIILLFVRLVVDWIQVFARHWTPKGPVLVVLEGVYTATDPPIKAFRRVFKPIRIGGMALDLSFLVVLLICYLLLAINRMIWFGVG